MSLYSWLLPYGGKPKPAEDDVAQGSSNPLDISFDFESLADQVEDLRRKYAEAVDSCEQANLQFDKYRTEMNELKKSLEAERNACIKAHKLLAKQTETNKQLQAQNKNLQTRLQRETMLNSQIQAKLHTETAALQAMTKHARSQEEKLIDTRLDLEYLKCTIVEPLPDPAVMLRNDAPLPAQPFVVVLVDGDAYNKWAPEIMRNDVYFGAKAPGESIDSASAGAIAATRIRNEVTKYILSQNGTIPIASKIVTRCFCNFESGPKWRKHGLGSDGLAEFALHFTEKLPLFDFFDAGRGKERADDKIRENFHLFLSTPNCHAIFVAACLDNGFARMLEQYSNHTLARQKIVLVSPGYMAIEIQKLGLTETQWPTVFAHRNPPAQVAAKNQKEKAKLAGPLQPQNGQRGRILRSFSTPSIRAGPDAASDVLPRLLHMLPSWDVNAAMSNASRAVGIRIPQTPVSSEVAVTLQPLIGLLEMMEASEDVD